MPGNPTFSELASQIPIAEFIRLQRILLGDDVKTYIRTITGVVKKKRGESESSFVGMVKYQPDESAKYDPGEIPTNWLSDPIAVLVCNLAKSFIGHRCILFQRNKDQSDDQPTGYRELVWIQVLELEAAK